MGRFIVTSGTHFDPVTFDEMNSLVSAAQERYDTADDAYSQIASDTEALERYISENENDSEAKKIYDNYKNRLKTLQENLWNNGYNAQTRRDLREARASYSRDIGKLNDVITRRREAGKKYGEAMRSNPNLVMGMNPANAGLNAYLKDDNFGNDWFSYDSSKFESEVGTEVTNRMKGMLRGLDDSDSIVRNPALKAIITRVLTNGATNEEVDEARSLAPQLVGASNKDRQQAYKEMAQKGTPVSEVAKIMIDTLADKYQATGIDNSDADDNQKARLINRGIAGFSYGIGAPDVKDFEDPDFNLQQAIGQYRETHGVPEEETPRENDIVPAEYNGKNSKKAAKRSSKWFGDIPMIIDGKTKNEIRNGMDAAAAVFSHDIGEESMRVLGFDVRRKGYGASASDNFLYGETVATNGDVYETRYNPKADTVQVRKKGSNINWKDADRSEALTRRAHELRKQYEDNLKWYKDNQPDLYDAATFDVDTMYDVMDDYDIPFGSIQDIADAYHADEDNRVGINRDGTVVSSRANGKLIEGFSGQMSSAIEKGRNGSYRRYDNSYMGIHKIGKDGLPKGKAIRNTNDIYEFDENGKITNLQRVTINDDGLKNGYFIQKTSKGEFATGVDMLNSEKINSSFRYYQEMYARALQTPNRAERLAQILDIKDNLAKEIQSIIGYENNEPVYGNTSTKNPYIKDKI